jgi:hypothetical protein
MVVYWPLLVGLFVFTLILLEEFIVIQGGHGAPSVSLQE